METGALVAKIGFTVEELNLLITALSTLVVHTQRPETRHEIRQLLRRLGQ